LHWLSLLVPLLLAGGLILGLILLLVYGLLPAIEGQGEQLSTLTTAGDWLALAGVLWLPLLLITVGLLIGLPFSGWLWMLHLQERNGRSLERAATSYLITLGVEDKVDVMEMREFWLGIRDGLRVDRRSLFPFVGWWQRVTGNAPYLVWCDLAVTDTAFISAVYLRVAGSKKIRSELPQAIQKALEGICGTAQITPIAYPATGLKGQYTRYATLKLRRNSRHPIRTDFAAGTDVRSVLGRHLRTGAGISRVEVMYRFRPAAPGWAKGAQSKVKRQARAMEAGEARVEQAQQNYAKGGKKVPYAVGDDWMYKLEADEFGWDGQIVVAVSGEQAAVKRTLDGLTRSYFGYFSGANQLVVERERGEPPPRRYPTRFGDHDVFSPAEVASLCHLAKGAEVPGLAASKSRVIEPERSLYFGSLVRLGAEQLPTFVPQPIAEATTPEASDLRRSILGWFGDFNVAIETIERYKGMIYLGPPGVGKSWAECVLALGDAANKEGLALIDPAGDLCGDIMARLDRSNWDRVCYLNPEELYERGRAATINVMSGHDLVPKPRLQAMILAAFKAVAGTNWQAANRMQSLLEAAIALVLELEPEPTIRDIFYLMTKPWYRTSLERRSENRLIKGYWRDFFDAVEPNKQGEMISPVVTRVTKLLLNPYAAALVSGARSTISMHELMESGKILLVALPGAASPNGGGDPTMALIGQLLIVSLRLAAARRNLTTLADRKPYHLIVDEAHVVVNQDIEEMVNLFRKLRISITLAFQNLNQIEEPIMKVLKASISNWIIFRGLGSEAEVISGELLGGEVEPGDVARLPRRTAFSKLMYKESPMRVATLRTLALTDIPTMPLRLPELSAGLAYARQQQPASGRVGVLLALVERSIDTSEASYHDRSNLKKVQERDRMWKQATAALVGATVEEFALVSGLQAKRDRSLRQWLLEHPGAVSSQVELIKLLSQLEYSRPLVVAEAEVERRDRQVEADEQRAKAEGGGYGGDQGQRRGGRGGSRGGGGGKKATPPRPANEQGADGSTSTTYPAGSPTRAKEQG